MNGEKARGLVPPQPNLGPEPWQEPDLTAWLLLAMGLAALAVLLIAWAWRRWRARGARGPVASTGGPPPTDHTPRDRLVGLSETIRDALTVQFGHSCRAKTTEELSADERLAQLLGQDGFRDLIQFLDRIDRLKFAPDRPDDNGEGLDEALTTWGPRMTALAAQIRVKPRARRRPGPARPRSTVRGVPHDNGTAPLNRR